VAGEDKTERSSPGRAAQTPFGKYMLLRHLATGGMAELYLARQTGLGGFSKDLVIKRILPRYVEHEKVVQMFIGEARIAASLNHPNIVHIYDIGQEAGTWYIAMEYIQGENLWAVARRGIEAKNFLPLEHAVKITSMVCEGLEYAHTRTDGDGRALRIVHRDISPSNLLLTYEGVAKIVDFGIARAESQAQKEQGLIAGKCHYMAPEALRGGEVDHRADVWSVGVVLWEMTLGRRLYRGKPEEVMPRVLDEAVPPPTFVRRDYPPALEQIVMRALEKHRDERYESAAQMMQDLEDFLAEAGLRTSSLRIGRYLKELFARSVSASPEDAARAAEWGTEPEGGAAAAAEDDLDFDRRPSRPSMRAAAESNPSKLADAAADPEPVSASGFSSRPVILASRLDSAGAGVPVRSAFEDRSDELIIDGPPGEDPARTGARPHERGVAARPPQLTGGFGASVERRGRRVPIILGLTSLVLLVALALAWCSARTAHSSGSFDQNQASVILYPRDER